VETFRSWRVSREEADDLTSQEVTLMRETFLVIRNSVGGMTGAIVTSPFDVVKVSSIYYHLSVLGTRH